MKKSSLMGIFSIAVILFAVTSLVYGDVPPTEEWVVRYDGPAGGADGANAIATDSLGNVYVAGTSDGGATGNDFAVVKYDVDGNEDWVARYDGFGYGDGVRAIAIDSTGVYVTGSSIESDGVSYDYATVKFNINTGAPEWVARYDGNSGSTDSAYAIAIDSSGVYVTGMSRGLSSNDYTTLKYDLSTGAPLWSAPATYDNGYYDVPLAIAVDSSGVYVTGQSFSGEHLYTLDYATVKYNRNNGTQMWVNRYNGTVNDEDFAQDIGVDASGNVYVTGRSVGSEGCFDFVTIKYSSGGIERWVKRYTGIAGAADTPKAMAVDSSGNVYITGISWAGNQDFVTIKYDTDGNQLWAINYDGTNNYDDPMDLTIDSYGNVYVTGESVGIDTGPDYATVKYNTNGILEWEVRYTSAGAAFSSDIPSAITVDFSGNFVYVTGWSPGGTIYDFTTIQYSQLGPNTQIENLIANVENLVNTEILNKGQGNALIAKLEAALKSLDKGNAQAACNQLQAFVNQVNAFINSGKLTPEQGQELINAANAVINELCI